MTRKEILGKENPAKGLLGGVHDGLHEFVEPLTEQGTRCVHCSEEKVSKFYLSNDLRPYEKTEAFDLF